jgi:VIT1/CCC1 family predicted Fe2+/Mn2+ transporter
MSNLPPDGRPADDQPIESASRGASVRPPTPAAPRASAAAMTGTAPGREPPAAATARGDQADQADVAQARRELEVIRRHHGSTGRSGSLRAAVFGINDGLVSNFSLVLGMAGANQGNNVVILAGVAGLVSGAFSMAAGEYVSMRVQREMFEGAISQEKRELETDPEAEQHEVEVILRAQGVPREDAERIAPRVMANPDVALDLMARQELGLDPDELGSPIGAALSSFGSFSVGALIPLLPFVLLSAGWALGTAVTLSGIALLIVGGMAARLSGRPALFGGLRMLLIGAAAAAVTYGIGKLFDISLLG